MYSFEQLLTPVWNSDVIYDESFTMIKENGKAEADFLYEVEEVISVTSADKTKTYEEGRDYVVKDNKLCLTDDSRIFCFDYNDVVMEKHVPDMCFERYDGKYSLFSEGHYFHDRQICVTYRKKGNKFTYSVDYCGKELPRITSMLKNGENCTITLYGDSISEGSNSSGVTLTTPFLPKWGNLLVENLTRHYDKTRISFKNPSRGGMATAWAVENAKELVAVHKPDLVIIAFGMNDRCSKEEFTNRIKAIMDIVREESPEAEFILCATSLPNNQLPLFNAIQKEYLDSVNALKTNGVAVADFGGMHAELMKHKRFIDMTGNNVNHPNDFLVRCHAQYVSEMLIEK